MRHTYIIKCADETLYTGVTTDLGRRLQEHNEGIKGAKYTRIRRPVDLIWSQEFESRSQACIEEHRIKHLAREEKLLLITS